MNQSDLCVLGASISGLTSAFRFLQRNPGAKVTVIGEFEDKNAATMNAGAMINVMAEIPFEAFEYEPIKKKMDILFGAHEIWDQFCDEIESVLGQNIERPRGKTYCILNSKSTPLEVDTFNYILDHLVPKNLAREINPNTIDQLKPTDEGYALRSFEIPDRYLNPIKFLSDLRSALDLMGATLINARIDGYEIKSHILKKPVLDHVTVKGVRYTAKNFILASGFDHSGVIKHKDFGILPVFANGGCALILSCPDWVKKKGGLGKSLLELDAVIRMVDRGGACGIHIVPRGDGSFYVGASSAMWTYPEYEPKLGAVQVILNSVLNEISYELYHYDVKIIGNGFRPTTVDAMPMIGHTAVDNCYTLNGFKRDAFTASPFASNVLIDIIEGKRTDFEIFDPKRKLLNYKNREAAVSAALDMMRATAFQHYHRNAAFKVQAIDESNRAFVESVYKKVPNRFSIHPEMLHLVADDEYFNKFKEYI